MLLQSLRTLCSAPGWSGSIWKYLEALVRSPGVSVRIACGFRTDLHFADVLVVSPPAAVAEEVLPRLGHSPSTPAAFVVISVANPVQVNCVARVP